MKQNDGFGALRWLAYVTTLGVSLITPVLLAVWLSLRLQRAFGLGGWIVIAGILLGLGGAAVSFSHFVRAARSAAQHRKEHK